MANCHKCGKSKIRKRKDGRKKCKHCGFLPDAKLSPPNPFGSCFDAAAHNLIANYESDVPNLNMCHGIGVSNRPGEEGKKIAHAWIEFDHPQGRVAFDAIWLVFQSAENYRRNLKVERVVEYPKAEFIQTWKERDYPGPWDAEMKKIADRIAA